MNEYLNLLGFKATDKVSKLQGVITSLSFDLYGCVQAVLSPQVNSDGQKVSGQWFDVNRLDVSKERVMERILHAREINDVPG